MIEREKAHPLFFYRLHSFFRQWKNGAFISLVVVCFIIPLSRSNGQACSSCASVTSFTVNLSANPDTTWSVSSTRSGQCCQGSGSDKCIVFYVTVSPKASEIKFIFRNGSSNNGSYEINCDPSTQTSPGNSQCLGGLTTFCITYCNPGNSNDAYTITTSSGFSAGPDKTVRSGCSAQLTISGLAKSSLTWNSVYPGATGAYNSYLSCTTACDTTIVTPGVGAPAYVDYVACGSRTGCTNGTYCDTQRVYMVSPLNVSITPVSPVICTGSPNVTLTATASGGSPPYSYLWNTGATTQSISVPAGSYSVSVSDTASSCSPATANRTVASYPAATVNAGSDAAICSGGTYTLSGTYGGSATSSTWTTSGTGTFNNASLLAATYTPSAGDIASGSVTLTLTAYGPCAPVNDPMILTINPVATVNAGLDATICAGSTHTLSGSFGGGAGSAAWTTNGSGTFNNASLPAATYTPSAADISAGSVTLTLTTNDPAGPCPAVTDFMVLTINPAATVDAGSDATICFGSTVTLSGVRGGSATSSLWTTSGTGTFNNSSLLNATYTPSASDISAGTVTLTLTTDDPSGPCPAVNDAMVLSINAAATVDAGSDATICSGSSHSLSGSRGGSATSSTWTTSGSGSFNNAAQLAAVYTPSAADISAGSVTLTLTTNDPAGPCPAVTDFMVLTINPAATVDAGSDATICSGSTYALSATRGGSATSSLWTTSGTGTFDDATLLNATYTPSVADISAGTVTLTLTTNDPAGPCPAVNDNMVLTINAIATADAGSDVSICSGNTHTLSGTRGGSASSSAWTTSGTGSFDNASLLAATYTPSAADILAGTVTLTLTTNDPAGPCPAASDNMVLTITDPTSANAGSDQTVCANNANVLLSGSVLVATGGSWSTSGSGTFSPNNNTLNATYIPSGADLSAGTVTLTLTTTGNGTCAAASDAMVVTITPAPTADAGTDQTVCANNANVSLNGSVTVATGGTWTTSGTGTFSPDNATLNATYTPSAADTAAGTVTLTLTTTGNGTCNAVSDNMIVTITTAPTVNAGSDQSVCANNANVNLNGSLTIATGGIWSSSGSGSFTPNNTTLNATYVPSYADTAAGTATLTLTTTGNGTCTAVSDAMVVTITSSPTSNAGADQTVCANNANVSLNGSVTVASGGSWSTSGSGTFSPNNTTLNATYTPSASDKTAGTVTLTLTTTGNGTCNSVSDAMVITITSAPTANAGSDQTVCANNASVALNGSVTVATGGSWSTSGSGTFAPNNTSLNATYTPSAADKAAGTVTLTLTTTGNGTCLAVSDAMVVTITAAPTSNAGSDQTVCANNASVILNGSITIASGGMWTGSGTGSFSPNNTTLNATYLPSAADTAAGSVTLLLTTTGNGSCAAVTDTMMLTITDAPVVNAGSDTAICIGQSVALNGSVSVATGGTWSGGAGSYNPNANTLNAIYTPTAGEQSAGTVTLTLTSTGNGTCLAVSDNVTITITGTISVNAGSDQTVCANNGNVSLNGLVSGGTVTGIWTTSGSGSFSPGATTLNGTYIPSAGDTAAGTVTLTLTSTNSGGCTPVSDAMVVTITDAPTANAGADQAVCANNASVSLSGSVTIASGGTWTTSGTGTFSPNNTTLNATYNPSAADKTAGTVTLTLTTTGNGTCNPVSDAMIVTITLVPTANAGADRTVCANNASLSLNGSVTVATGGAWSTSGSGSFTPNNTTLNATYIPSAADKSAGTVTLTLTTTGNGSCIAVSDAMVITITAAPTANAGPDQSVCANNSNVSLNGSVTVASGGTWTTTGTGTFSPNNTTLNAAYAPSAADKTAGTVTLTLTTTGNGTCIAVSDAMVVTITAAPTANAGSDQTVCANNANVGLNGNVTVATGGSWSSSGSGSFSPNNTTLNATYIPSAADKTAGTVTLTLTTTGNGTCTAVSDAMIVSITAAPTANAGSDQTVCANNANVVLNGSVTVATGGIWSTSGSGSFSPNNTTLNATYIPSAADKSAGTVTLTLTTTGNGTCSAVSDAMVITITTGPTANAGSDQTVCANNASVGLNGSVTIATGGSWSTSGSGTFSPNSTTLNATYNPSAADKTAGTVTLTLTTTGNGICAAVSDAMLVTITSAPTVNAGSDQTVCANNANVSLSGSVTVATGGSWSTSGSGTFSPNNTTLNATYIPSAADKTAGTVTLTLTTTGNGTCVAVSDAMVITITTAPTSNAGVDQTVCANNATVALNGSVTVATGGSWSTSGTGTFSPNNTTLNASYIPSASDKLSGSVTLTLTTTGNGTCAAVSDNMVVTITAAPTANAGSDQTVCANNANVSLSGSVTVASGGSWSSSGTGSFTPNNTTLNATYIPSAADKTSGSVTLTLTTTGNGSCVSVSDAMTVTITTAPTSNAGLDQSVCASSPAATLSGSVTIAGGGTWSGGGGSFNPNNNTLNAIYTPSAAEITAGSATLILTTTGNGNCIAVADTMMLTITPVPSVNAGSDQTVCGNNAATLLAGTSTTGSGSWVSSGTGTFTPNNTTLNATYNPSAADISGGTVTLTLSSTNNGGCLAVNDAMSIVITPAPTANAGSDQSVCANNANVNLHGSVTVAGGGSWSSTGSGSFAPNNTSLIAVYIPSAADKTAGTVTLTLTTTGNGNCNAVSDAMVVTITSSPTASAGPDQVVCANNASVSLNGSVTVATGGSWSASGSGSFSPNNNVLSATYIPSAADIAAGSVLLIITTTGNGSCISVSDTMVVTITPAPVANAGADQSVCANNAAVSLTGSVTIATGGTWSTSGTGTFSPNNTTLNASYIPGAADIAGGAVTLTLTTTGNGSCAAVSDAMIVTITSSPVANAGTDQSVCANNASVSLNGNVTIATGGLWTSSGTGAFAPDNITLNGQYNPSAADTAAGSVILVLTTTGNGTCNAVSDSMLVTITDAPLVNAGADRAVCINNPNVSLNGTSSTGSGSWVTSGGGSFSPNNTTLNATYIPDASDLSAGTVVLTLTSAANGSCLPVSDDVTITFTSVMSVNAGLDQTVCNNNAITSLNGSSGTGSGQWSTLGDGVFSPNNTTLNANYSPGTADLGNGLVTLTLTTTNNGSCLAVTDEMNITITPKPTADAGPNQVVCANNASVFLGGSVSVSTGGSWTSSGSGSFSPNNTTLNATYIPSPADIVAGTVTLLLTTTGNGNCLPVSDSMQVTITPAPTVNAGSDQSACYNNPNVTLSGAVTVATGGIWTSSGSGSFSPNNTSLNATYIPDNSDLVAGSVILTLASSGNGSCSAVSDDMTVTFTPAPTANAGTDQTVCANNATVSLNGSVTVASGGSWTTSGTGSFTPNNTALNASYVPSASDKAAGTITLTLTTTGNANCTSVADDMVITITSAPVADAGSDQTVCANNASVILNGNVTIASGGYWSTPGNGSFSPDTTTLNAGFIPGASDIAAGYSLITLTTTGNGNCAPVTDTLRINITPAPVANAGSDQSLCQNNGIVTLNGNVSVATGGSWGTSGTGIFAPGNTSLNATYTPSNADTAAGSVMLTLTTTGNGSCLAVTDTMVVTYSAPPSVIAGSDQTVCANNADVVLNGTSSTGFGSWSSSGTGIFSPSDTLTGATYRPSAADTSSGSVILTLTSTHNGGCIAVSDQISVTITAAPAANAGSDQTACANNAIVNLNGSYSFPASGAFWSTSGSGTFLPDSLDMNASYTPSSSDTANGTISLYLITTGNGQCLAAVDSMTVVYTDAPVVNAGTNAIVCLGSPNYTLNGYSSTGSGQWTTSGDGTFSPGSSNLNATYIPGPADTATGSVMLTLTSTSNASCNPTVDTIQLQYTDIPVVSAGSDQTVCANNAIISLNATSSTGTAYWSTSGDGTFGPDSTALNGTYNPGPADTSAGSVVLTLTSTNGCVAISESLNLTITVAPYVDAGSNQSVCKNNPVINLTGAVWGGASTGTWTTNGAGSFSPDANTLNATYNPDPADLSGNSLVFVLTSTGNGNCLPTADSVVVAFTPSPSVNAGSDLYVCDGTMDLVLSGSVSGGTNAGQWTTTGTGTFTPNANDLNATYHMTPADTSLGTVAVILTSTGNGNCIAENDTLWISITAAPVTDAGSDMTLCANNSNVQLNGSVVSSTGTGVWASSGSGTFMPDSNDLNAIYLPDSADLAAGSVVLMLAPTNACVTTADSILITFTPAPVVQAGSDIFICSGTMAAALSGIVSGGSTQGQWTTLGSGSFFPNDSTLNATYNLSPADTANGFIHLVLTSTNNGNCTTVSDTVVIYITTIATTAAGSDTTICANAGSVQVNGTITGGWGTGQWTTLGGGSFSPDDTTLNAMYLPDAADISAGSVNLVLASTNTCMSTTDTVTITITPSPVAQAGVDQLICIDDSVYLNGSVTVASGGQWVSGGTGTFIPDDMTLNAVYIPSASDISAGSVSLVLNTTGNGNCNGESDTMEVTIASTLFASAGNDTAVCGGSTAIPLNGAVTGMTSGIWTTSGDGTFVPSNATLNATYQPGVSDTTTGSAVLVLSVSNSCYSASDSITVTFESTPVANAGWNQAICPGDSVQLNGSTNSTGGIQWTTTGSGTFSPDDMTLNAIYIPSAGDIASGSVLLTLSTTGTGICNPSSHTIAVTISSTLFANAGNDTTVCGAGSSIQLNGTVTGMSAGTWTTSGDGTFIPNNTTLNASYQPGASDTIAGGVTLMLSTSNSCASASDTVAITILNIPVADAGADQIICSGDSVQLNASSNLSSGILWTSSGNGTFTPDDSTLNAVYVPDAGDIATGSVTLFLAVSGNGACSAAYDTMTVAISAPLVANAGNDTVVCSTAGSIQLDGSVTGMTSGTWTTNGSGSFVPNNTTLNATYEPGASDTTAGTIMLILSASNTCSAVSDTMLVAFENMPVADAGADQSVCPGDSVQLNGTSSTANGIQWVTTGSGSFIPNDSALNATYVPSIGDVNAGYVVLNLQVNGAGNCTPAVDSMMVTITSGLVANAGNDTSVCGSTTVQMNGVVSGVSSVQWSTTGSGTFIPNNTTLNASYQPGASDTIAGSATLILSAVSTCSNASDTVVINYQSAPVAGAGIDQTVCSGDTIQLSGSASNATSILWTTSGSGTFVQGDTSAATSYLPDSTDVIAGSVDLYFTAANSCVSVIDTMTVNITASVMADAGLDISSCGGEQVSLSGAISPAASVQWISGGDGSFSSSDTLLNTAYIPGPQDILAGSVNLVLVPSANGSCPGISDSVVVTILPLPVAAFDHSASCVNGTTTFTDASFVQGANLTAWMWEFGTDTSTLQNPSVSFASTGMQSVTLIATTGDGCSDTITHSVYVNPEPVAAFTFTSGCPDPAGFTDASTIGSGSIVSWNWDFGDFSGSAAQNPAHSYADAGIYTATLTVVSDSGCVAVTANSVVYEVCDDADYHLPAVPTAFTPNGDGHNDIFYVRGGPFRVFEFRIFNEWGNEIFRSTEQSQGWDGKYKGVLQPGGKYMWTLNGSSPANVPVREVGEVMLIRK